ncbi:serine O-acetyltransferase [Fimbriimonas ginsengisoli]|uniref:Serine acetyltransferase n=1 Tax=Fimbriimonas ginsengisoli Gsoil 348 TaxID=661478 RepID=A0A068NTB3_FIMGI|nr:hypothetical protein [Fimbriimonas ginsengisoli]AIE86671.1 Serine acetyltransferase [Fimbriimonas ginsengisoli Gsoil 348]
MNPIILYRLSRRLHLMGAVRIARLVYRLNYFLSGCSIPPQVSIGTGFRLPDYGNGVIMNAAVEIGNDVMILPHVVLGQNVRKGREVVSANIRIGDGVVIGAGAKVIASGELTIGPGAVIGANAVVIRSVPDGATAVGIPAKLIRTSERDADAIERIAVLGEFLE